MHFVLGIVHSHVLSRPYRVFKPTALDRPPWPGGGCDVKGERLKVPRPFQCKGLKRPATREETACMKVRNRRTQLNPAAFERRARRNVAQWLRKCRLAREITQTTLARRVGVTYQQIQKYETGRDRLSIEWLMLIAEVLDVPVERLLFGTSRRSPPPVELSQRLTLTCDGLESLGLYHGDIVIDGSGFLAVCSVD